MNNTDIILRTNEVNSQTETSASFSEEDIDDILSENGFIENTESSSVHQDSNEESLQEALNNITDEEENSQNNEEEDISFARRELWEENNEEDASSPDEDSSKLPLNSPTLLIDDSTSRFSGTEWYNEIQKARVIIAGIGGIGSNVAFQLARMVPANITMYDDDDVEAVNMAGQLYSRIDIGKAKVDAIANMIRSYTSVGQINAIKKKFTNTTEAGDIMICGFDSMAARHTFFSSWLNHIKVKTPYERSKCLYLDGRLSIDTLQIFCITGDDTYNIDRYADEFLFPDYKADATVCSMKQTTYLACMIGSLMVNLFTNFIANTLNPIIPYDLPFFTEYDAQNMIFKTEK